MRKALLVLLLLSAPAAYPAFASGDASDLLRPLEAGWREDHRGDDFAIYSRKSPSSRFRENLLIGVLDHPPGACFRVATDYPRYTEFMPYCAYTRVVHTEPAGPNRRVLYVFLYLDLPVLSNRYLTSRYLDEADVSLDGQAGCYRSTWTTVKSGQHHRTPASPDVRPSLPDGGGIEIAQDRGSWTFSPLEGGAKTRMRYFEWSDPGGYIPSWVNNMGGKHSLTDLWKGFSRRLAER